jgi:hypothetical protein
VSVGSIERSQAVKQLLDVLHDTLMEQELPVGQLSVILHRLTLVRLASVVCVAWIAAVGILLVACWHWHASVAPTRHETAVKHDSVLLQLHLGGLGSLAKRKAALRSHHKLKVYACLLADLLAC